MSMMKIPDEHFNKGTPAIKSDRVFSNIIRFNDVELTRTTKIIAYYAIRLDNNESQPQNIVSEITAKVFALLLSIKFDLYSPSL